MIIQLFGEILTEYSLYHWKMASPSNIYEKRWRFVGKLSKYRIEFNSLKLFNDPILLQEFIDYSIRDSIALYEALIIAQKIYITDYNVNITTVHSTSTLSLKIFRANFQDVNIPTCS
jgi:hypothetical protein